MKEIRVSITQLSDYVSRSGDLAGGGYQSVSGIEGTRLHRKVFDDLSGQYGNDFECEVKFRHSYEDIMDDEFMLTVSGRCDCLIESSDDIPHIIEIKSFNSTKDSYDRLERTEHLTQLKLYGAIYLFDHEECPLVRLTLRYVSITTLISYEKSFEMDFEEASAFWEDICSQYLVFAKDLFFYKQSMLRTCKELKFPYEGIRPGQKEFMENVLRSIRAKEALFVEAPTGTGKTISTLYPAVKGLVTGIYSKIYYLTAKIQTRQVAVKAVNDMRSKGLIIRSLLAQSKENMCPFLGDCDDKFCPLAKDFYARLKPALNEILTHDDIEPELVKDIAARHKLCPHELMLNAREYCNIVIGDYNHVFDPRSKIICEDPDDITEVVLVDESHNMISRSRDMYSAEFSSDLLRRMQNDFKGTDSATEQMLNNLSNYFNIARHCFESGSSGLVQLEKIEDKEILSSDDWEGTRLPPRNLYAALWRTIRRLMPILDKMPSGQARRTAMEFFFEARFFLTILEQYYNDAYITTLSREPGIFEDKNIVIKLDCLDAANMINDLVKDKLSVVFFSATLSPYEYYRNLLIGKDADYVRHIDLPSPFPQENLDLMIDTSISTTFKDRNYTLDDLALRITDELSGRFGNYMIFFPSFDYMNKACSKIQKIFDAKTCEDKIPRTLIKQIPEMTEAEKTSFLANFDKPSNDLMVAACVLGGHFAEGIDLVGERLKGVIIVGVGIPTVTGERQVLCNYYNERFGDGYAFAYRFPGWEKVLQATGRVIRTEEDTGFALLIDSRLSRPEYVMLYPEHWKV
ncbi:MAG: ATP-dependent DNA helicase [Clostridiales bacterium]|nr:ATP-dependent DNA helicase [Clostridiales bacterium]